jgi:tetratricopeptide (TPR) repeat protein
MARRDWYRRSTWTAVQREEFFQRLSRCRAHNRSLYLRIQAASLQAAEPATALELLDYLLEHHPDRDVLAGAHLDRARCLELLDRLLEAALAYRAAIDAERAQSGSRAASPRGFGMFCVRRRLRSRYREAIATLDEFEQSHPSHFASDQYQVCAIRALVAQDEGQIAVARTMAAKALAAARTHAPGRRQHAATGMEPDPAIHKRLELLAG